MSGHFVHKNMPVFPSRARFDIRRSQSTGHTKSSTTTAGPAVRPDCAAKPSSSSVAATGRHVNKLTDRCVIDCYKHASKRRFNSTRRPMNEQ